MPKEMKYGLRILFRIFESCDGAAKLNIVDKTFFWTSIAAGPGVWGVFALLNILTFSIY